MSDLISRQAAIDACLNGWNKDYKEIVKEIRALPSATPQYTDAEIQKMQELEQAEIQKAYEIGKEEGSSEKPNKWIPVSQPPEKSGAYLVSMRYVTHDVVAIASYATDLHRVDEYNFPKHEAGWYNYDSEYGYYKIENVIVAYMPLPEPYKASPTDAESEDKK